MPRIHLVIGPVGAGKSTFVATLRSEQHAVAFNLDAWMALLFSKDRPASDVMAWARVDAEAFDLRIYVLDAPREVRLERVLRRNETRGETFSMLVPREIFELASDLFEPLTADECEGRDVRFIASSPN